MTRRLVSEVRSCIASRGRKRASFKECQPLFMKRRARVLFLLALAVSLAVAFTDDDEAKALPAGAGKEVVVKVCLDCHGAGHFRGQRLSQDDWSDKVYDMTIIPKRVSQKVQARSFFPQVHHPRLFPVDLQLELPFQP